MPNIPETLNYVQKVMALAPAFEQVWRSWMGLPVPPPLAAGVPLPVQGSRPRVRPTTPAVTAVACPVVATVQVRSPAPLRTASQGQDAQPVQLTASSTSVRPAVPNAAVPALPPVPVVGMTLGRNLAVSRTGPRGMVTSTPGPAAPAATTSSQAATRPATANSTSQPVLPAAAAPTGMQLVVTASADQGQR